MYIILSESLEYSSYSFRIFRIRSKLGTSREDVEISEKDIVLYPRDELTTFLLPVTRGRSYNQCGFCSMYKYMEVK